MGLFGRGVLLAALLSLMTAWGQPFKRTPLLKVDSFTCDGVEALFVDRTASCRIAILYRPDSTVPLSAIKVSFVEDCWRSNGTSCKRVVSPVVFSKGENPFEVYPLGFLADLKTPLREAKQKGYTHVLAISFKYRIDYTVEYFNPGLLGLFSSYGKYQKDEYVQQVRAKLSVDFANGISFPLEAAIKVRY